MQQILLSLLFLNFGAGVVSQFGMIQPPSQFVSLGNTTKLPCHLMSGHEVYAVSWYQQTAGQPPRLVLTPNYSRSYGIPNRFSGSKSGLLSQPTTIQPASASASLGQEAKLSCTVSTNVNHVYWYQQKSGESPHFVHCDGCSSRGPGIPDRFTGTRTGNNGYLTITNLEAQDEADYYCNAWFGSANVLHSDTI